jgi:hypothetical protein
MERSERLLLQAFGGQRQHHMLSFRSRPISASATIEELERLKGSVEFSTKA